MTTSHLKAIDRRAAALRESEERFQQIADSAPVPMWVTLLDRTRSFANRAYLEFVGLPYEEACRLDWRTILHPADHDRIVAESIAGEASMKPFVLEARYRRGDGEWRWLRSESQPRFGPDGAHIGFIGVAHDITAFKQGEEMVRLSEARMRLALKAGGITDWYWDRATNRVRFSDHARRVHRLGADVEPTGEDLMAMVVEEDRARSQAASDHAIATGEPYHIEHRVRGPDGRIEWVANYSRPVVENGAVVGVIGMTQVITPRKLDEEALKEREAQLSAFVSQSTAGFAQVDLDGRFTLINDRFCEITGRSREELLAVTMQSITHEDDLPRNEGLFAAAVMNGTPYTHEKRYVRPDGSDVWVNNSVAVIRRGSGEPYGVLAISLDITERRRAEELQKLLINELNHRVKNTLAMVQGIARQTFADSAAAPATRAFEGRLVALAAAHNLLTDQNWEAANLSALIEASAAPCLDGRDRMRLSGPAVLLAPKRAVAVALAVHELCTNAVKYGALSNDNGEIEVNWRAAEGQVALIWTERGGPEVIAPARRGFGSRMLERALAAELQGEVTLDFARDGLVCRIDFRADD